MNNLETVVSSVKRMWPTQLLKDGVINTRLIWLGILGIGLLLVAGMFDRQTIVSSPESPTEIVKNQLSVGHNYEEVVEEKLAHILSQVKGAGTVIVNITWENSSMQEHAKNVIKESKTIQEKDTAGGIRTTTETKESEQILVGKENGVDRPVLIQEKKPIVKGVLIIAEGAQDSTIKANLTKAVEAGLGVPSYKITVLAQKK